MALPATTVVHVHGCEGTDGISSLVQHMHSENHSKSPKSSANMRKVCATHPDSAMRALWCRLRIAVLLAFIIARDCRYVRQLLDPRVIYEQVPGGTLHGFLATDDDSSSTAWPMCNAKDSCLEHSVHELWAKLSRVHFNIFKQSSTVNPYESPPRSRSSEAPESAESAGATVYRQNYI